jgi:hypothetical protein
MNSSFKILLIILIFKVRPDMSKGKLECTIDTGIDLPTYLHTHTDTSQHGIHVGCVLQPHFAHSNAK